MEPANQGLGLEVVSGRSWFHRLYEEGHIHFPTFKVPNHSQLKHL